MKNKLKNSQRTLIALGALLPLIAGAQEPSTDHGVDIGVNSAATFQGQPRDKQSTSKYDLLIQKLEAWEKTALESTQATTIVGDELVTKLGKSQIKSAIDSIKTIRDYRDAVEKQCKGIDDSASILVDTLDFCLVNNVISPAFQKAKLDQGNYEVVLLSKAINSCQTELGAFFSEKEKKAKQGKIEIVSDKAAKEAIASIFGVLGGKKLKADDTVAENSELIKAIRKVEQKDLCQAKVETTEKKPAESKPSKISETEKQETIIEESAQSKHTQPKSEYKEKVEEIVEEEETYVPIKPQIKTVAPEQPVQQPIAQPVEQPKPAPQPQPISYQPTKPTYQPVPPKARDNNTPFIPVTPAPKRAPVVAGGGGGPVPVAAPFARGFGGGFGLSLGFGTYSSTITAPPPFIPPMPYPPVPMPMPLGGSGGMIGGTSSGPRACLVCSTVTPMPTLGLGTMLQRPCPPQVSGQPIGACRPNMNQPMIGYGGVRPNFNQIPRVPGSPVYPGVTPQPTVNGGRISPNRTTIPRNTSGVSRTTRRVRR